MRGVEPILLISFVAGIAALAIGAWMAWPPAGPLVLGAALVLVPIAYARGSLRESSDRRLRGTEDAR